MKKELYITHYEITIDYADFIIKDIEKLNPNEISELIIFINCNGGSAVGTYKLLEALKPFKGKITTVACFNCKSAATLLFFYGDVRYIFSNCVFFIHKPVYKIEKNEFAPSKRFREILQILEKDEEDIINFYRENNIPEDLINYINDHDQFVIDAKDLYELGIVNKIIPFSLEILV